MKSYASLLVLAMILFPTVLTAQEKKDPAPVSSVVKLLLDRYTKNVPAAAEAMPADKYSYKPTPDQMTYAHLMVHIVEANNLLCSKITDATEPKLELADTDSKEKLVAGVKASFAFCAAEIAKMDESKLGDTITLLNNQRPWAIAAILLTSNWADHYGMQAIYLRLNGILPPTAQPKK